MSLTIEGFFLVLPIVVIAKLLFPFYILMNKQVIIQLVWCDLPLLSLFISYEEINSICRNFYFIEQNVLSGVEACLPSRGE